MTLDVRFRTRLATLVASVLTKGKNVVVKYWKKTPTVLKALATLVIALNAAWQLYTHFPITPFETNPKEKVSVSLSKEKMASPLPDKPSICSAAVREHERRSEARALR